MEEYTKAVCEMENYLDMIRFFGEGTEDSLFLWNIQEGQVHFTGDIYRKLPLPQKREVSYTVEECRTFIYTRDKNRVNQNMELLAEGKQEVSSFECRILDREGHREWVRCRAKAKKDESGEVQCVFGRLSGNVLLRKSDALTGLFNGEKFMEDMQKCLEGNCHGHLLLLGIDNFKHINIKYGRQYGNQVLCQMAEVLEECVDGDMNIYRLDGDRFAVAMNGQPAEAVKSLYAMTRGKMKEYCTLSAGAFFCGGNTSDECSLIYQYAEAALDRAKEEGKDQLVFFSKDHYKKRFDTISLMEEMKNSVKDSFRGFYLLYQPLIRQETSGLWGAEALLRYETVNGDKIGPVEFIPLLEQNGLIGPVGEWVLKTALAQCREWRHLQPEFHMNVNISYIQLRDRGITGRVLRLLEASGVPGSGLTLEVTESMRLQDYQYFNKMFRQWEKAGIHIAIDDFGTGYSSLSYLKSLDIDEIKIDRSFVTDIQNSAYNYRLLKNVIDLARSADIKVCCEGVETREELAAMQKLQPDLLQGYYFSKPCEADALERKFIKNQ